MEELVSFLLTYKHELLEKGFVTKKEADVFDKEFERIDDLLCELSEIVDTLPRKPKQ